MAHSVSVCSRALQPDVQGVVLSLPGVSTPLLLVQHEGPFHSHCLLAWLWLQAVCFVVVALRNRRVCAAAVGRNGCVYRSRCSRCRGSNEQHRSRGRQLQSPVAGRVGLSQGQSSAPARRQQRRRQRPRRPRGFARPGAACRSALHQCGALPAGGLQRSSAVVLGSVQRLPHSAARSWTGWWLLPQNRCVVWCAAVLALQVSCSLTLEHCCRRWRSGGWSFLRCAAAGTTVKDKVVAGSGLLPVGTVPVTRPCSSYSFVL